MNHVHLIGNVGADPKLVTFENGTKLCHFFLATNKTWTDQQSGEKKQATEWHNIVVNNPKSVDPAMKYIKKGAQLAVFGEIRTQTNGEGEAKKYFTKIVCKEFKFLDKAPGAPAPDASFAMPANNQEAAHVVQEVDFTAQPGDDDLPF